MAGAAQQRRNNSRCSAMLGGRGSQIITGPVPGPKEPPGRTRPGVGRPIWRQATEATRLSNPGGCSTCRDKAGRRLYVVSPCQTSVGLLHGVVAVRTRGGLQVEANGHRHV